MRVMNGQSDRDWISCLTTRNGLNSSGESTGESYLYFKTGSYTLQMYLRLTENIVCSADLPKTHGNSSVSVTEMLRFQA